MPLRAALLFTLCTFLSTITGQNREIDSIFTLLEKAGNAEESAIQKAALAPRLMTAGRAEESEKYLREALAEAAESGKDRALGYAHNAQGVYFFYSGNFDSAQHWFERAAEFFAAAKEEKGLLKIKNNMGGIHFMNREYREALALFEEALRLEEKLGYEPGTFVSFNNLAVIYRDMNVLPKAEYYYRKGVTFFTKTHDYGSLSTSYDGLAQVFDDKGEPDSALHYSALARDYARQAGDLSAYTYAVLSLANIHMRLDRYNEAVTELRQITPYTAMINDKRLLIGIYGNMAGCFVELGQLDSADKYIELLMPLHREVGQISMNQDLTKIIGEYYFRKGDFKTAYGLIKNYTMVRDSLYQVELASELSELQEKYESEKKDRENKFLQSENRQVKNTRNYLVVILSIALLSIVGGVFAYVKIRRAHRTIRSQKELVEQKQQEIIDSINYARRIQYALLASQQLLKKHLPEHFVLFKPKDVVSGDFYWASPTDDGFAIVAGDCTGHGVPGAFMSLLNITKLGQVINEQKVSRPDLVLNKVREEIIRSLNPEDRKEDTKDGMDAIICKFSADRLQMEYAAANNSFYIVRERKALHCKADKMPVGKGHDDTQPFTLNQVKLHKGDMVYLFTDGFADQFGGPLGKKFKYRQLEHLLVAISNEPLSQQKEKLEHEFERWRGALEQVDDVCVIGIRI